MKPDYEVSLVAAMREQIEAGDDVVIVGGGYGVSAVVARRYAGRNGSVTVYEGAASQISTIEETLSLNESSDGVTVNHAIVGDGQNVWEEDTGAPRLSPTEIPSCDILALDCEGSEVEIIEKSNLPKTVIVETHGVFDAPTAKTRQLLIDKGFSITEDRIEIEEEDVHVLTAVQA
ncbi:hypothetical protein JMJ58_13675 [Haloterrigena salifodinae]|uniref:Methyltransferase FkbM domain-containing protein n=1 Tax=Haloterrigena salifodinae TaxID=2675099 RepID=A0A8T8DXP2_9EURY|nr:hypothetical protein [Haloterrigena salifodinae]QRV13990.1 hypothetical protein JMJ58_13675 [Haloterrigena salifodinae]